MTNTLKFKVPEHKQLTPEQLEASGKRLDDRIESWKKFEREYPEVAKNMYC